MKQDLKDYIEQNIEDSAQSHLEAWKDRYANHGGNKEAVKTDLYTNHDNSLEIEQCEEELKRELTDKEKRKLTKKFNKAVFRKWRNGNIYD